MTTTTGSNILPDTAPAPRVFCFGELLLRLSPRLQGEWIEQSQVAVYVGGAELNAAQALARWEVPVSYGTALPDHYLTREIIESLEKKGVDCSAIFKTGERIGTYYLPAGADLKHAGVIYDRAYSSFAGLKPGMLNWTEILKGKHWFHFSAISPALNEDAAAVCLEAAQAASAMGLTVSVDLNYRAKLWQYGRLPAEVMPALVAYCDVIMGNAWAAQSLLGIASPISDSKGVNDAALEQAAYQSMEAVKQQFPRASCFAYTYRLEKDYWAVIQKGTERARSVSFATAAAVDRVGSGDCFMAGLIYGIVKQYAVQDIINFAASAAVGKLAEKGDATNQTTDDVWNRLRREVENG